MPANRFLSGLNLQLYQLSLAFRILAFGIFVTQFRIVTGTEKHCCQHVANSGEIQL